MTEDKYEEARRLRNNLKEYENVERAAQPEHNYKLRVWFSGRNDVSSNALESFLGEDFEQLQAVLSTLTRAAIEVRRNKLQAEFDKL